MTSYKNILAGFSELHFTSTAERFHIGFWQNEVSFFDFPTLPAKNYPRFVGKFLATLSKMQTGCPGEQFAGKYSLKNYKVFHHIRILSGNFSYFWQEKFGRLAKNAIWVSRRTFWGQTSIEKIFMFILIVFGLRGIFFENFEGNTSVRLSSLQSICPGEEYEQNFFWHFWIFSKKFGIFAKQFFRRVVISAILISRGRYWGKVTFLKDLIFKSF